MANLVKKGAQLTQEQIEVVGIVDVTGQHITPASETTLLAILSALGGGGAHGFADGEIDVAVTNTPIAIGSGASITIFISAKVGNTDVVVVGGPTVVYNPSGSRTGKVMYPGDTITVNIDNLNKIYVNGDAGNGLSYSYTY